MDVNMHPNQWAERVIDESTTTISMDTGTIVIIT